ncbi:MAG: hypothetical protein E7598_01155 [Ruminococcaceae bacterium]|nr:hypothetical protein [Oscillospiraceae bacterium]
MNYIGKWVFHSIGEMTEDGELRYMNAEEYIASPMPYIDENDAEEVADELAERKKTVGMELRVLSDGTLYMLMPIPEGVSKEEVDEAVAAGEITLYDGMMCDSPKKWEERDGTLWFDSGIHGEVFGEAADPWVKATDDDGFFNFMSFRFVKGE